MKEKGFDKGKALFTGEAIIPTSPDYLDPPSQLRASSSVKRSSTPGAKPQTQELAWHMQHSWRQHEPLLK